MTMAKVLLTPWGAKFGTKMRPGSTGALGFRDDGVVFLGIALISASFL